MEFKKGLLAFIAFILLFGCRKDWEQHYSTAPVSSKVNVWAAIQADNDLSQYVQYVKKFHYDTLFKTDATYTLFVPTNEAFVQFLVADSFSRSILNYNICTSFLQSSNIVGTRQVQTLSKKFALFVNQGNGLFLDTVPISFESPAFVNGKYFKMGTVAKPRPNLYEYIAANNIVLKRYIDSKDSIVIDKTRSKPIGFDSHGNTIYDTVSFIDNLFEDKFFPVSKEFRNQTATIVFPKVDDYNAALTLVAKSLNLPSYSSYLDIPQSWQNKILIPYLLVHGIFPNMVEAIEFQKTGPKDTVRLKNILGDSIIIDYLPSEKTLCSNGYAYNYQNFKVPDTLYSGQTRFEGEFILRDLGVNSFAYKNFVNITNSTAFPPVKSYVKGASNDTIFLVYFTKNFKGTYTLKFNVENLFPRRYRMIVRTNVNVGGIYNVYMNGVVVKANFDYYVYKTSNPATSGYYTSPVTAKKYKTSVGFNIFDCLITNLTDYDKAELTFEYIGPGTVSQNGLSIDYIAFVPW